MAYGCLCLVVSHDVSVKRAHEDHPHHGREEDGDQDRVDQTEPLHVALGHGTQDVVPARGPADVLLLLHRAETRESLELYNLSITDTLGPTVNVLQR